MSWADDAHPPSRALTLGTLVRRPGHSQTKVHPTLSKPFTKVHPTLSKPYTQVHPPLSKPYTLIWETQIKVVSLAPSLEGVGCRVSECRVQGLESVGFRGVGCRVWGLGVSGVGFRECRV